MINLGKKPLIDLRKRPEKLRNLREESCTHVTYAEESRPWMMEPKDLATRPAENSNEHDDGGVEHGY